MSETDVAGVTYLKLTGELPESLVVGAHRSLRLFGTHLYNGEVTDIEFVELYVDFIMGKSVPVWWIKFEQR